LRADEISTPWRVLSQRAIGENSEASGSWANERERDNFLNNGKIRTRIPHFASTPPLARLARSRPPAVRVCHVGIGQLWRYAATGHRRPSLARPRGPVVPAMGTQPIITRSIKPPPGDILVRWNPTAFFSVSPSEIEAMLEIILHRICHPFEREKLILCSGHFLCFLVTFSPLDAFF
jgi:hypothetical protein